MELRDYLPVLANLPPGKQLPFHNDEEDGWPQSS